MEGDDVLGQVRAVDREDIAFAESRIRKETIAAEDILHDLGAISIISSDSQAMGRIGEVVLRTWQTAHQMKRVRGALPGETVADNARARRYVAKYTICPAVAHGPETVVAGVDAGDQVGNAGEAAASDVLVGEFAGPLPVTVIGEPEVNSRGPRAVPSRTACRTDRSR